MDWHIEWDALGTWLTGVAAAYLAWKAHTFTEGQARRQEERDRRAMRALALTAFIELVAVGAQVDSIIAAIDTVLAERTDASVRNLAGELGDGRSIAPREWLGNAPAFSDLPEEVGLELGRAINLAAQFEPLFRRLGPLLAGAGGAYSAEIADALPQVRVAVVEIQRSLAVARGLLYPLSGLKRG